MKLTRKRFTAPAPLLAEAEQYATLDHRTFSELVCEALRQHMRRYPKKGLESTGFDLDVIVSKVAEKIALMYPQVPSQRN